MGDYEQMRSEIPGLLSRDHMEVEHLLIACIQLRVIYTICECQYSDQWQNVKQQHL